MSFKIIKQLPREQEKGEYSLSNEETGEWIDAEGNLVDKPHEFADLTALKTALYKNKRYQELSYQIENHTLALFYLLKDLNAEFEPGKEHVWGYYGSSGIPRLIYTVKDEGCYDE